MHKSPSRIFNCTFSRWNVSHRKETTNYSRVFWGRDKSDETMTIIHLRRLVPASKKEILFFPIFRLATHQRKKRRNRCHPEPSAREGEKAVTGENDSRCSNAASLLCVDPADNVANASREPRLIELSFRSSIFRVFSVLPPFLCSVWEKNWCELLLFNRVLIKKEWFNFSVGVAACSRSDAAFFRFKFASFIFVSGVN